MQASGSLVLELPQDPEDVESAQQIEDEREQLVSRDQTLDAARDARREVRCVSLIDVVCRSTL